MYQYGRECADRLYESQNKESIVGKIIYTINKLVFSLEIFCLVSYLLYKFYTYYFNCEYSSLIMLYIEYYICLIYMLTIGSLISFIVFEDKSFKSAIVENYLLIINLFVRLVGGNVPYSLNVCIAISLFSFTFSITMWKISNMVEKFKENKAIMQKDEEDKNT